MSIVKQVPLNILVPRTRVYMGIFCLRTCDCCKYLEDGLKVTCNFPEECCPDLVLLLVLFDLV